MPKERWSYEIVPRYGTSVFVIYDDGTSVGSVNLDDEDIELWQIIMKVLNLNEMKLKKLAERLDSLNNT